MYVFFSISILLPVVYCLYVHADITCFAVPGLFVPKSFRSQERKFLLGNECSMELSFPGTFVLMELSFRGHESSRVDPPATLVYVVVSASWPRSPSTTQADGARQLPDSTTDG